MLGKTQSFKKGRRKNMAKYGAKYLQWAPFYTSDPDKDTAAFPKYGTPLNLGSLVKVTDNPK